MEAYGAKLQLYASVLAAFFTVAHAGLGPSTDSPWEKNDTIAYSVVLGVAGLVFVIAIILYCQLQYFQRIGKIELAAEMAASEAIAKREAEEKARQIAAQKEQVRKDIAAQKAKQKTK